MAPLIRLDCILPGTHTAQDADTLQALLTLHVSHGWEEQSLPTGELVCTIYHTVPASAEAWKEFFTPVEQRYRLSNVNRRVWIPERTFFNHQIKYNSNSK